MWLRGQLEKYCDILIILKSAAGYGYESCGTDRPETAGL